MGKKSKPKSSRQKEKGLARILLVTALIEMISNLIELIKSLID